MKVNDRTYEVRWPAGQAPPATVDGLGFWPQPRWGCGVGQVLACNYTQGRGRQSGNVQLELRDAVTGNKANEKTSPDDIIDSAHASSTPPALLPTKPPRTTISTTAAFPTPHAPARLR